MMQHVIPYDTRLSSLIKKRDFTRHRDYFNIMQIHMQTFGNGFTVEALETELIIKTLPLYRIYSLMLLQKFTVDNNDGLKAELDEINEEYKNISADNFQSLFIKYKTVIKQIEDSLEVNQNTFVIHEQIVHIQSFIYKIDQEKMMDVLMQTFIALTYLDKELKLHAHLFGQDDKQQELDYLIKVVNFELWNFISHISHAYTDFFKTPKLFINDIEKATSHLRRGIMDIYDGLIVDIYHEKITPEYLNIRNQKIFSLGQSKEISSLSERLKQYYLEISK